jgi:hypothetical protein
LTRNKSATLQRNLSHRMNLLPHACDEKVQCGRLEGMTDVQAATEMELAATAGTPIEVEREQRMPLGVIVYVVLASAAQALWLGLISWWLLNLF